MTRREYCLKTICWPDRSAAFQNTSSRRWRERWWPLPCQKMSAKVSSPVRRASRCGRSVCSAVSGMKPDRDRVPAAHVERVRYLSRLGLGPSHEQVAAETLRLVVVHAPVAPARRRRQRLCRRAPVKVGKIDRIGAVAPVRRRSPALRSRSVPWSFTSRLQVVGAGLKPARYAASPNRVVGLGYVARATPNPAWRTCSPQPPKLL